MVHRDLLGVYQLSLSAHQMMKKMIGKPPHRLAAQFLPSALVRWDSKRDPKGDTFESEELDLLPLSTPDDEE